jgi:DNA-binding transcriptional ArsR family regulator
MEPMSNDVLEMLARRFKLLANPARLAILQRICAGEETVSALQEMTGLKQSHVSKQLGMLDAAGMVRRRTDGNRVYYMVADASLPRICEIVHASLAERQQAMASRLTEAVPATGRASGPASRSRPRADAPRAGRPPTPRRSRPPRRA